MSTIDFFGKTKGFFSREVEAKPAPAKKPLQTFHAVSIQAGSRACAQAKALEGKRFLSRQAPVLPLKACTCASCECRYQHHEDRRKGPRRARDFGVSIAAWEDGPDLRNKSARGRRKTDR